MKQFISNLLKNIILTIVPDSNRLRFLAYRPMLETWRKNNKDNHPTFTNKLHMYDYINQDIIQADPIQYLEFGVFQGTPLSISLAFTQIPSQHLQASIPLLGYLKTGLNSTAPLRAKPLTLVERSRKPMIKEYPSSRECFRRHCRVT